MARRGRMSRGHSRSQYRAGARNVHPKNLVNVMAMRGGYRL